MTVGVGANGSSLDDGGDIGLLRLPRAVLFGPGQRHAAPEVITSLGAVALVCCDQRIAETAELTQMLDATRRAGVAVHVFSGTEPELPVAGIEQCLRATWGTEIDVVVGVGGGSCLDMAKVMAVLLAHGGRIQDYYGELAVPGPVLPVVAIPTTAGTGSEATPVAVVADPERAMKVGISSPHLIPHTAICDPLLTRSCPPGLTAAAGVDALTHLVEAFTAVRRTPSPRLATERVFVGKSTLTDEVALAGLRLLGRSLLKVHRAPDATARAEVMKAALAGGVALGTAGTAAAHALQYPIGAITHTPHGVGVGTLLPYVMRYNLPVRERELATIGRALDPTLAETDPGDERGAAVAAIRAVDALVDGLGLPRSLADLGLPEDRLEWVAEHALGARRLVENNPRPLNLDAMRSIASAAHTGDRTIP